jgi:hypothetical protein
MDTNKEGEGHPRITRIDANVLLFNGISFSCLFVCFVGRFLNFYYSKSAFVGQRPPGKPSASSPRHDLRCDPPLKSDAPQAGPPRRQMMKTQRPANGFTRRTKRRCGRALSIRQFIDSPDSVWALRSSFRVIRRVRRGSLLCPQT